MILIPGRSSKQGTSLNKGKLKEEYQTVTSTLEVNEDDMIRLGLEAGDKVKLSNEIGETIVSVKKVLSEKIDDLHKIAKALLVYETLSGDEIRDLILKDIKPTRSFKEEENNDSKSSSSALGSLGLKPKPAI